jgi:predicted  nucleic acid-binding Zn-ribbon protein
MFRNIELDENIIKKNKVPILIKDREWQKLFQDNLTKSMEKLTQQLEELIAEEKECMNDLRKARKKKKILMEKILKLSNEVNTNDDKVAIVKLEQAKNMILEINDKIDELQFKLETLPNEIKNINFKLLKETVTKAYDDIKEGKNRISCLDKEIQRLRKILGNMWEEKFTTEKKVNNLYLYLHGILGHRETDKLDKKFL